MIERYLSKSAIYYPKSMYFKRKKSFMAPVKLNLGCGSKYLKDYVNIDVSSDSVADVVSDFRDIDKIYPPDSVSEILLVHSISYLRLWECLDFFNVCFKLLKEDCKLILEFPDLEKCASLLIRSKNDHFNYMEAVRGIYAFDMDQIKTKEEFSTYRFGWSAWHIEEELRKAGFKKVTCTDGALHSRKWRDTRVEATK